MKKQCPNCQTYLKKELIIPFILNKPFQCNSCGTKLDFYYHKNLHTFFMMTLFIVGLMAGFSHFRNTTFNWILIISFFAINLAWFESLMVSHYNGRDMSPGIENYVLRFISPNPMQHFILFVTITFLFSIFVIPIRVSDRYPASGNVRYNTTGTPIYDYVSPSVEDNESQFP